MEIEKSINLQRVSMIIAPFFVAMVIAVNFAQLFWNSYVPSLPTDHTIMASAVQNFWIGKSPYDSNFFVYFNYFVILAFWMALPTIASTTLHIVISEAIIVYLVISILKSGDRIKKIWMNLMIFPVIVDVFFLNVNLWILLGFYLYQRYRPAWWAPLFLLLSFYKATAIPVAAILFIVNYVSEKKIYAKEFIGFFITLSVTFLSFILSDGLMENINYASEIVNGMFLQPTHLLWFAFPLLVLIENLVSGKIKLNRHNFVNVNEK